MKTLEKNVVEEFSTKLAQKIYIEKAREGMWESEKVLVKKYFKPGSSILDIGCGTGRTTLHLNSMGYNVVGLDLTPKMIENAKKIAKEEKVKIEYVIGNATKLNYPNESFDNALFSNQGWSQIPGKENRQKAMEEAYRVLKEGGHYIFTTHIRTMKGYALFWIKQWLKVKILKPLGFNVEEVDYGDRFFSRDSSGLMHKKQYIHIPTANEVGKLIEKAGFALEYMAYNNEVTENCKRSPRVMFYVCKK
jgi:ubiquinone/menaquinone biosynthesis C-methylase UbiE